MLLVFKPSFSALYFSKSFNSFSLFTTFTTTSSFILGLFSKEIVIIALPFEVPLIFPSDETVATLELLLLYFNFDPSVALAFKLKVFTFYFLLFVFSSIFA